LDIRDKYRVSRLQIALGAIFQRGLNQLGRIHAARHQQRAGLLIQAIGLVELIEQGPGRQALPDFSCLRPQAQHTQQQHHAIFHRTFPSGHHTLFRTAVYTDPRSPPVKRSFQQSVFER